MTLEAAPGVSREDVRLVRDPTYPSVYADLVHVRNVTVRDASTITNPGTVESALWLEEVDLVGTSRIETAGFGWFGGFAYQYITDSYVTQSVNGPVGYHLIRDVTVHGIGQQPFSLSPLVLNSTAWDIDAEGSSLHPDVYMCGAGYDLVETEFNLILYGVETIDEDSLQTIGILCGGQAGMAVVDSHIGGAHSAWQSVTSHLFISGTELSQLLFRDATAGSGNDQANFTARDIVIEGSTFYDHGRGCEHRPYLSSAPYGTCPDIPGVVIR